MSLKWLNKVNGADLLELEYSKKCLTEFEGDITAVIMGSAYGGAVEAIAKLYKGRGKIYGFDTFEDLHPGHLHPDQGSFEVTCMDHWYNHPEYGKDLLSHEYQTTYLKDQGLDNAILVKGEVGPHSVKDIDKIHYCFLDMDIPTSMDNGYQAVKDKIVPGGYILLHDIQNIKSVGDWYKETVIGKDKDMWHKVKQYGRELVTVIKRK